MKNFKLLLASTAILSTGALLANADVQDSIDDLHVKAEIINDLSLEAVQPLDFGKIVIDPEADGFIFVHYFAETGEKDVYGVTYNSGVTPGKVCFTDMNPNAVLDTDLHITVDDINVSVDPNDSSRKIEVKSFDFGETTATATGKRCVNIGGLLSMDSLAGWTGAVVIDEATTVTVLYDY